MENDTREKNIEQPFDVVCIGTALLDSILQGFDPEPVSASGYLAASGTLHVGGEAVNEAVTFAKLGMKTGIFCYLGEDDAGAIIEKNLKENGVDTGLICWERDHSTPVTTMFVRDDGSRMSVTNLSHSYNFHPETRGAALNTRAISLCSLFRAPFDDPAVIHAVVSAAKDSFASRLVFADTKIPNFHPLTLEDIKDSLPLIDYMMPNEDEGRYYTGKEEPEAMADVLLNYGVRNVIIKLGEKGCLFKNADETIRVEAFPVKAVDSTGAGDNFIAGFASELLRGRTHKEALLFANACGAVCASAVGGISGVKSRAQIEEFLKNHHR